MNEQPFYGKRVIIVHGYTASPSANWFPWLRDTLATQGAQVLLPSMPDSQSPQPLAWAKTLDKLLPHADTSTFLIGHSLGCVALMRHLQSMPLGTRIGGYVLVSGFDCGLSTLPELAAFTSSPLNYAVLRERAAHRASIISADDAIVAPQASHQLAEALQTRVVEVKNGGHFLDRDGYTSLPPVYETLQAMLWGFGFCLRTIGQGMFAKGLDLKSLHADCKHTYVAAIATIETAYPTKFLAVLFKNPTMTKAVFDSTL